VEACARAGIRPADAARAFLAGGATFVQLRAKRASSAEFLALIDTVVGLAEPRGATVVVNDRIDLARLGKAAGVHLGQTDLAPRAARLQLGDAAVVGWSTHTETQLRLANAEPISYVAIGPVFQTTTKDTGYAAVGLEMVLRARDIVRPDVPIVAIGGITLERAMAVIQAGASAVAVIGDLLQPTPEERVQHFLRLLNPLTR
jgi:thiamine-phosphate pyrophosphorylase